MAAKLPIKLQKLFGTSAGLNQRAQFGSLAAGSPVFSTDPDVIQALANFVDGWFAAVVGDNSPAIEDMNALCYVLAYQLVYVQQAGVPEYLATKEYFIGSLVTNGDGSLWVSRVDNNLGQALTAGANWWPIRDSLGRLHALSTTQVQSASQSIAASLKSLQSNGTLQAPTALVDGDVVFEQVNQGYFSGTFRSMFFSQLVAYDVAPDFLTRLTDYLTRADLVGLREFREVTVYGDGAEDVVAKYFGPVIVNDNSLSDTNLGTILQTGLFKAYRGTFDVTFAEFTPPILVTVQYTKINDQVTLTIPATSAAGSISSGAFFGTGAGAVPSELSPDTLGVDAVGLAQTLDTGDSDDRGAGIVTVSSVGAIRVYKRANENDQFSPSGAETVGWNRAVTVTYKTVVS